MLNEGNIKIEIVVGLVVIVFILIATGFAVMTIGKTTPTNTELDEFAKCLTEKGAKMYDAYWCHACKVQKEMFGSASQYIKYVECDLGDGKPAQECIVNNITSFPVWEINGVQYKGLQQLSTLAQASGCELKKAE